MDEKKIVIIGAGPTGLGAAYRLKELGYKNFHMYERSSHLGGLASSTNFKEFCESVFGDGICKYFMSPYNFKVWAHPLEMMNKEWIGERVAVVDIKRAIKNVVMGTDDFGWGPNNTFKFPLYGGT